MDLIYMFIVFIGINLASLFIGNLPECIRLPKLLDFKPLNCKLCLSTHTCWVLNTIVAILINSWIYFIMGIISAIIIYLLIRYDEKQVWE